MGRNGKTDPHSSPPHRTVTHRLSTWMVVVPAGGGLLASVYTAVGLTDVITVAAVHCAGFLTGVTSHLYCDGFLKLPGLASE